MGLRPGRFWCGAAQSGVGGALRRESTSDWRVWLVQLEWDSATKAQDGLRPSQRGRGIDQQQSSSQQASRKKLLQEAWWERMQGGHPNSLRRRENKRSPTAPPLTLDWEDNHKKCHPDWWRGDKVWSDEPTPFQGWCVFLGASLRRARLVNLSQCWSL